MALSNTINSNLDYKPLNDGEPDLKKIKKQIEALKVNTNLEEALKLYSSLEKTSQKSSILNIADGTATYTPHFKLQLDLHHILEEVSIEKRENLIEKNSQNWGRLTVLIKELDRTHYKEKEWQPLRNKLQKLINEKEPSEVRELRKLRQTIMSGFPIEIVMSNINNGNYQKVFTKAKKRNELEKKAKYIDKSGKLMDGYEKAINYELKKYEKQTLLNIKKITGKNINSIPNGIIDPKFIAPYQELYTYSNKITDPEKVKGMIEYISENYETADTLGKITMLQAITFL